jgi:PAS domain-containing protein
LAGGDRCSDVGWRLSLRVSSSFSTGAYGTARLSGLGLFGAGLVLTTTGVQQGWLSFWPASAALFTLAAFMFARNGSSEHQAFRRQRLLTRKLVDASRGGIFVVDRGLTIREWNPVLASVTGVSPRQAIGRPLAQVAPSWAQGDVSECLTTAFAGVETCRSRCEYADPRTAAPALTDVYCTPVLTSGAQVVDVLCIVDFASPSTAPEREAGGAD